MDDRSEDRTAERARSLAPGNATALRLIDGAPLPDGWFGKPWACQQGAHAASGDLLLFTDADTRHAPDLLARAVAGLREDGADATSLIGRQIMESFWERLIQPHVFALLLLRFPDLGRTRSPRRWRRAAANGQYLMVRRAVYESLGGHEIVAGEVVEDLRFAQELVRAGYRLTIREAEDALATRMYRSLNDLVEGWAKSLWTAARQSAPGWAGRLVLPVAMAVGIALWLVPPAVLVTIGLSGCLASADARPLAVWSVSATTAGFLFWTAITVRFGTPASYGVLYPLGAAMTTYIAFLSWIRGRRIRWKGRTYGGRERGS